LPAVVPPPPPAANRGSSPDFSAPRGAEALRRASSSMPAVVPPRGSFPSISAMAGVGGDRGSSPKDTPVADTIPDPRTRAERFSGPPLAPGRISASGPIAYIPGDVIGGKYRLVRVIGQGGMGKVWIARNLALDADVALKLIRRDRATEEAAARLLT